MHNTVTVGLTDSPFIGTSGARLYIHPACVVKTAHPEAQWASVVRLKEQGQYMREVGPDVFPEVYSVFDTGYVMEPLMPVNWQATPPAVALGIVKTLLAKHVWRFKPSDRGPASDLLGRDHVEYVAGLCDRWAPNLTRHMLHWLHLVEQFPLARTRIHGDPTLDNLMRRKPGPRQERAGHVLTDPIPASVRVPGLMAVDLGKMLQSVVGYERVKYGDRFPGFELVGAYAAVMRDESEEEAEAAHYFCAVHMLRLMPYQPQELRPKFMDVLLRMVVR